MKYNCTKKTFRITEDKRLPVAESTALLKGISGIEFSKEYISYIVTKLRDDDVGKVCREDNLIMRYGALQFEKYHMTQNELIRQNMRQLGRFLIQLKNKVSGIKKLSDCLHSQKFDEVVKATKSLCINQTPVLNRSEFHLISDGIFLKIPS